MKLFLKILFFVLAIFQTNNSGANIVVIDKIVSEIKLNSDFVKYKSEVAINLETDFGITCKSKSYLVDYRNFAKCSEATAAKGVSQGTNVVYQGFNKAGVVEYVGITGRDAAVRFGEHLSSGTAKSLLRYEVVPGATNLSRTGARVWEQTLINQHGLNNLLNVRNSIAPKYWFQYGIKP